MSAPIPGSPLTPPFPMTHVGKLTADGAGHFSGHGVQNTAGMGLPGTFSGTYTVTLDCIVSFEMTATAGPITSSVSETGVITGEGEFQELRTIVTTPGIVFADTITRR